jgi:hypothetical protein
MESSSPNRRFPAPWRVERSSNDCYCVRDANGVTLAAVYCRDDLHQMKWADYNSHLTSDEARRIATAIARIPEFLKPLPGFYSREGGDPRWKRSRPYHVALRDSYVRENWDRITALCAYNNIPFDPTGQRIDRDGHWCVYEFARQVDAAMFWDRFEGRWLRHNVFFYFDRPDDIPVMKTPPNFEKLYKKNGR